MEEITQSMLHSYAEYNFGTKFLPLLKRTYRNIKKSVDDGTFTEFRIGNWYLTRSKFKPCYVINRVDKYSREDNHSESVNLREAVEILFDCASYTD